MRRSRRLPLLIAVLWLSGCAGLFTRPQPPHVGLAGLEIVEAGLFEQQYLLRLRLQNPNDFALPIRGMTLALALNDRGFARGVSSQAVTVPPFGTEVIEVKVFSNLATILARVSDWERAPDESFTWQLNGGIKLADRAARIPFEAAGELRLLPPPDSPGAESPETDYQ